MRSRRKICSNVALTELVPAPDEPVIEMMGCFTDMGALPSEFLSSQRLDAPAGAPRPACRMPDRQRKGS
ncbi:hypothetical protein LMG27198_39820 [Methylocystis echinoides]|uniref:Uncharacterized protein n=1 Tax=Methylocystis echinoides TaxID=29468 RepID=A0A9W6GY25_9HYPH|nr:hypothetical protein LMG27198_39820 [Methylocystis echinoides]